MFKKYLQNTGNRVIAAVVAVLMLTVAVAVNPLTGRAESTVAGKNLSNNAAAEVLDYNVNAEVGKNHSTRVVEKITVKLAADAETFSFEIPNGNFRLSNVKLPAGASITQTGNESSTVTITNPKNLTAGIHTYTVEFQAFEFSDRDSEKDMYYFYALIPNWQYPISKLNVKFKFPDDFPWDDVQYYAGQFGVQSVSTKIDFKADKAARTVTIKGNKIPDNFAVSIKAQLPDQYWEGELDGTWALLMTGIVMGVILLILLVLWIVGGRDPRFAPKRQTHPVEGVTPEELHYIFNRVVSIRDVVGMVVYFGTKGYLRISEYQPKKYQLIRKNYPADEKKYLRHAYDILFEGVYEDRALEMDELGIRLKRIKNMLKANVAAGYSTKDMRAYTEISQVFRIIGIVLMGIGMALSVAMRYNYQYMQVNYLEVGIVFLIATASVWGLCSIVDKQYFAENKNFSRQIALAAAMFMAAPLYSALMLVHATGYFYIAPMILVLYVASGGFVVVMRARAKGNAALVNRLVQLRQFIYHPTPKEVVANHIEDNNYYYEILPYAMMFDGLETWAISFLTVNVPPADWFTDDIEGHAFSNLIKKPGVLGQAKNIKTFYRTIVAEYHAMERRFPGNRAV